MAQYFQAAIVGPLISLFGGKKMGVMLGNPNQEDYGVLLELVESGKMAPVIDRIYPLSEGADALRHYGGGNARGKIVIKVEG